MLLTLNIEYTIENCSSARSARRTIGIMGGKISEDLIGVDPFIQLFKAPLDGSAALPTIQCSSRQTFSQHQVGLLATKASVTAKAATITKR